MLKIGSLVFLLLISGLIIAIYLTNYSGSLNREPIGLNPESIVNESIANNNTRSYENLVPVDDLNIDQNLTQTIRKEEKQRLVTEQFLVNEKNLDLSPFNEQEILVLRKYMTHYTVSDEEIPIWFRIFSELVFLQGGEKRPDSLLSENVDNNWIAANAYNHDIQHWEDISSDGDVLATAVLAIFYEAASKFPEAENYYQKLFVNVSDKSFILHNLINTAFEQDDRKAAAYAWHGQNQDIGLSKYTSLSRSKELRQKYSEHELATELIELNSTFEYLKINYANSELVELGKLIN